MGHKFEINKEIALKATPEQVWQAITTPDGQAAWLFPADEPAETDVERAKPERYTVRTPMDSDGSFQAFEYIVSARNDGTAVLRLVHSGFLSGDWADEFVDMTSHGWEMYLHTLAQYFTYFPGRPAHYIEAEAPFSSAGEQAWMRIEEALGLTRPAELGDRVDLTVDADTVLNGVVDYIEPSEFLGVRTDDALYRFHCKARLGMPVAIGHHVYASDVDPERLRQSWQSWLNAVFS